MNLKEIRKKFGLSQTELAKIANTSQKTISNYEKGSTEPDLKTIIYLADYFHTTIDQLVGHKVAHQIDKFKYNAEQLAVIEELEKLNKEQCFALLAFIEGMKSGKTRQDSIIAKLNGGNNEFNAN